MFWKHALKFIRHAVVNISTELYWMHLLEPNYNTHNAIPRLVLSPKFTGKLYLKINTNALNLHEATVAPHLSLRINLHLTAYQIN